MTVTPRSWWWQQMLKRHRQRRKAEQTPPDNGGGGTGTWQTVAEWDAYNPLLASGGNFATFNARIVLDKSLFPVTTSKIRLSFDSSVEQNPADGTGFTASVGLAASGGNAWDFASAPIAALASPITLVGVGSGDPGNRYLSDEVPLVVDGTKDVVVSMLYAAGETGTSSNCNSNPPDTWHLYLNMSGGAVDDMSPSGLIDVRSTFGDNQQWALSKVEVFA